MKRDEIQLEALNATNGKHRCTLAISMGVGKTLIALQHMDAHKYRSDKVGHKFLVVIPKVSLKKSWLKEMEDHGYTHLKDRITFSTYRSLHKQDLGYDCIYLDECHSLLSSHVSWLCKYENRILGLTGTPPVHRKSTKYQLLATFAPIAYEYLVDEAVNDEILNDYQIVIHELELSDVLDTTVKLKNGAVFKTSEVKTYNSLISKIENAVGFKQIEKGYILLLSAMKEFMTKERYAKILLRLVNEKCIVFCNTKAQADRLATYSYHSSNPNSARNLHWFQEDKIKILTCVQQLNEGINIPNLKCGVILHSYANERQTAQRLGRLLRLPVGETAVVHILVYKNTIDEMWLRNALKKFDINKVFYADTKQILTL